MWNHDDNNEFSFVFFSPIILEIQLIRNPLLSITSIILFWMNKMNNVIRSRVIKCVIIHPR